MKQRDFLQVVFNEEQAWFAIKTLLRQLLSIKWRMACQNIYDICVVGELILIDDNDYVLWCNRTKRRELNDKRSETLSKEGVD